MIKSFYSIVVALSLYNFCLSQNAYATGGWVTDLDIERVLSHKDRGLAFAASPININSLATCNSSLAYMSPETQEVTIDGAKATMSTLLTAFSTDKKYPLMC